MEVLPPMLGEKNVNNLDLYPPTSIERGCVYCLIPYKEGKG